MAHTPHTSHIPHTTHTTHTPPHITHTKHTTHAHDTHTHTDACFTYVCAPPRMHPATWLQHITQLKCQHLSTQSTTGGWRCTLWAPQMKLLVWRMLWALWLPKRGSQPCGCQRAVKSSKASNQYKHSQATHIKNTYKYDPPKQNTKMSKLFADFG